MPEPTDPTEAIAAALAAADLPVGWLVAAIESVVKDHRPRTPVPPPGRNYLICTACARIWPCTSVRAIYKAITGGGRLPHYSVIADAARATDTNPPGKETP